jgi:uncharacterized membrane protein
MILFMNNTIHVHWKFHASRSWLTFLTHVTQAFQVIYKSIKKIQIQVVSTLNDFITMIFHNYMHAHLWTFPNLPSNLNKKTMTSFFMLGEI